MRIDFYYTQKKVNSMVRPDIDENQITVTTFTDFNLKDDCSLNAPTFIIVASNMPETNYCIMSNTGATAERPDKYYYFIDEIIHHRKTVWYIKCTIDALATWKDVIKTQDVFVLRSTSHYHPYIIDTTLPTLNQFSRRNCGGQLNNDFALSANSGGCVIFTCAASGSSASATTIGGVRHYAMSLSSFGNFCESLYTSGNSQQIKDLFGNVSSAIFGAFWCPLNLTNIDGTNVTQIFLGGLTFASPCKQITGNYYHKQLNIPVSLTHYGDFRDNPPFREYWLELPWVGEVNVDGDTIGIINRLGGGSAVMSIDVRYDFLSGTIKYSVYIGRSSAEYLLTDIEACAKVDLPISAYKANIAGIIGGVLERIGSRTATATPTNSGVDAVTSATTAQIGGKNWYTAAGDAIEANTGINVKDLAQSFGLHSGGSTTIVGGYSGNALGGIHPMHSLYEKSQTTSVEPSSIAATFGRPYHGVLSLGSVNGYVKTSGFCCKGRMSFEEKAQIERAFNGSGVYDL